VKITAREKRFLVIGGCVCAGVIGWYVAAALVPNREDQSAALELNRRKLLRQKETLQEEEAYKARLAQYQERLAQRLSRCLPFDNPSIAGAELQKLLSELADQAGVDIQQKNIQKEQKLQDDLTKISVRIETNCSPQQLVQFLTSIENYDKHLTLDELVINGFRIQRRFEIRPAMTVSGFIAVPETKAEEKPAASR
jgi:chromatin segregation and condensation protein Rec8/ScpA/Scc1 (kleisin family)